MHLVWEFVWDRGYRDLRVTIVVHVFCVSSHGNSGAAGDRRVDVVDAPEGIDDGLVANEGPVTARLESGSVAAKGRVKGVDRS